MGHNKGMLIIQNLGVRTGMFFCSFSSSGPTPASGYDVTVSCEYSYVCFELDLWRMFSSVDVFFHSFSDLDTGTIDPCSKDVFEDEFDKTDHRKWVTGFRTQYTTLLLRNLVQSIPRLLSKMSIIRASLLLVICVILWFQLPRDENTENDRHGLVGVLIMLVLPVHQEGLKLYLSLPCRSFSVPGPHSGYVRESTPSQLHNVFLPNLHSESASEVPLRHIQLQRGGKSLL